MDIIFEMLNKLAIIIGCITGVSWFVRWSRNRHQQKQAVWDVIQAEAGRGTLTLQLYVQIIRRQRNICEMMLRFMCALGYLIIGSLSPGWSGWVSIGIGGIFALAGYLIRRSMDSDILETVRESVAVESQRESQH